MLWQHRELEDRPPASPRSGVGAGPGGLRLGAGAASGARGCDCHLCTMPVAGCPAETPHHVPAATGEEPEQPQWSSNHGHAGARCRENAAAEPGCGMSAQTRMPQGAVAGWDHRLTPRCSAAGKPAPKLRKDGEERVVLLMARTRGSAHPPAASCCRCTPAQAVCRLGTRSGSPAAPSCAGSSVTLCSALPSALAAGTSPTRLLKSAPRSHLKTHLQPVGHRSAEPNETQPPLHGSEQSN